ncbi:MAG: hypothetical protein PSV24_16470 [Rhodoferax sp.]|nr:hypothetical protein [Rhodoferax sp.]
MLQHSEQLEMLHNKLSLRYGHDDTLCRQVFAALESCRKFETAEYKKHDWSVPYEHTIAVYRQATLQTHPH